MGLLSPRIPSLSKVRKIKKFLLNLSIKCRNSAFNAQGSGVIIVVVQVGAVKIYVASVEALTKKERGSQNRMKLSLPQKMVLF